MAAELDQRLTSLNEKVQVLLEHLANAQTINELQDDDVLVLQVAIKERECQLQQGLDEDVAITGWGRRYLSEQLRLTQAFEQQAVSILAHYQSMLHIGHKSKRQLKVYQTVAANK